MSISPALIVVSGPSGSGKTTLCRRATDEGLCQYSISCTTRPIRSGEINGTDYHFLTPQAFQQKLSQGAFLEHALVHGNFYGTLKQDIIDLLLQGSRVVMDIDVQGAAQIRACTDPVICQAYRDIYIHVPPHELLARLSTRSANTPDDLELRMTNAKEEDAQGYLYHATLTSADRESDYATFRQFILQ